jgi:hypothetical protein
MDLPCCLWVTLSFAETKIYLPRLPDLRLVQNTNIRSSEINRMAQQSVIGHARGGGSHKEQSTTLQECLVPNNFMTTGTPVYRVHSTWHRVLTQAEDHFSM